MVNWNWIKLFVRRTLYFIGLVLLGIYTFAFLIEGMYMEAATILKLVEIMALLRIGSVIQNGKK